MLGIPPDISKFLFNGEGLSKTAIGDYLGERHDFNQLVLDAFVTLQDFSDLILVQALRYVAFFYFFFNRPLHFFMKSLVYFLDCSHGFGQFPWILISQA